MFDSFIEKILERFTGYSGNLRQGLVRFFADAEYLVFVFRNSTATLGSAASMLVPALRKRLPLFRSDFLC